MGLTAELGCPQCGAPIGLDEADHLVSCPFCKVTSFLSATTYHFVLPHREVGEEMLFAPYLRFKGVIYCVNDSGIQHRIADVTSCGLPMKALPLSLGVRPQAMRLRFAVPKMGSFLKNSATVPKAIADVSRSLTSQAGNVRHLCLIGETVSRIYLPITVRNNQAYDAVSGDLLGRLPPDNDLFAPVREPDYNWYPRPLAALCPLCGWNLEGAPASVVLVCHQCDTVWQAGAQGFEPIEVKLLARAGGEGEGIMALPFWRIEAEMEGAALRTRADFIRLTGQPISLRPEWEEQPFAFWSPAFKVRPKIYLQAARQMTVLQPDTSEASSFTLPHAIHPITMPLSEAVEALRLILACTTYRKKDVMPLLAGLSLRVTSASLALIPFTLTCHDFVQEDLELSINRKSIEYGNRL
ncbi:MAG: hypothetical protein PHI06_06265 [Desulfobulbaceae bacterium]|nr:hypothetical protein [Desulfobulbaceae bacterium]